VPKILLSDCAEFGADIWNRDRAIVIEKFSARRFLLFTLNLLTLTSQLSAGMLNIRAKLHENRNDSERNESSNELTNEPTNSRGHNTSN